MTRVQFVRNNTVRLSGHSLHNRDQDSRRFIDVIDGHLSVSADTGGEKWGRRFDPEGKVNPVLQATATPWERTTDFVSKVPEDADFIGEVKVSVRY